MKIVTSIQRYFPRRRQRQWRYVSGRRHRVGLALFALIILLSYGWWYFTNDKRVEVYAEQYLQKLTGAQVRIGKAEFSLSQGIKLSRVRAFLRNNGRQEDLFEAKEVYLRQEPLSLLSGSLRVSEVTCVEPVVVLVQENDSNRWRAQGFLQRQASAGGSDNLVGKLPVLRFRSARIRFESSESLAAKAGADIVATPPLDLLATPDPGTQIYTFTMEQVSPQTGSSIKGQGFYNIGTHEVAINGWLPLDGISAALPARYRQWYERYKPTGNLSINYEHGPLPNRQRLVARLLGVSMDLPAEQGGLRLTDLTGRLIFDDSGIQLEHLEGQLPQMGGAVAVDGQFDGYDSQSPFEIRVRCDKIVMPLALAAERQDRVSELLTALQRQLNPTGPLAIAATLSRARDGKLRVTGEAQLQKMSFQAAAFPYRLDQVQGKIEFGPDKLVLHDVTAQHGSMQLSLNGEIADPLGRPGGHMEGKIQDLSLDSELHSALPEIGRGAWRDFSPEGLCNLSFSADQKPGQTPQANILLTFDGRAAVTYAEFPYRADHLVGSLSISNSGVQINGVTGQHHGGEMTLSGLVRHDEEGWHADVRLQGNNIQLDDDLGRALPASAKSSYYMFNLAGQTDLDGRFIHPPGGPMDYDFTTRLKQVSLTYNGFGYAMNHTEGALRFTPQRVLVNHLSGMHEQSRISVDGQVLLDRQRAGVDLAFAVQDMALDKVLYAALPPEVKGIWDQLVPSGLVDMEFRLRPDETPAGGRDYELKLHARKMALQYEKFPYPVRNLEGLVTAVPGRVELKDLSSVMDATSMKVSGTITTAAEGSQAELAISARNLPVDGRLVQAIPPQLKALAGSVNAAGQCDVELRKLRYVSPRAQAPALWSVEGQLGLQGASLVGARDITGKLDGHLECTDRGDFGAIGAEMNLVEATLDDRHLTRIAGTISKPADSPLLEVKDLSADAYGGRMAGFAQMALTSPNQYGLNLTVEGIRIDDLLNAGAGPQAEKIHGLGDLAGSLEITGVLGQPESRRASGVMHFRNAETGKLPVMWGLLNVALLQMPRDSLFREGSINYHMKGNTLTLQEVYLGGGSTSLLGSGTMQMPEDQIHLTFVSGPSKLMPTLLGQLMQITSRNLFQVRVTGTLRHPMIESRPLGDMNDLLKEMVTAR